VSSNTYTQTQAYANLRVSFRCGLHPLIDEQARAMRMLHQSAVSTWPPAVKVLLEQAEICMAKVRALLVLAVRGKSNPCISTTAIASFGH